MDLPGGVSIRLTFQRVVCFGGALFAWPALAAPEASIQLKSLEHLDLSANAVQFKNKATGQYIVLKADPRGGGVLEGGESPEPTPWFFYQGAGAAPYNVEIKRAPVAGFNWSNYQLKSDAKSFVAWNHAKRLPNATSPQPPHDWTLEEVAEGLFRIRYRLGTCLELMPGMPSHIRGSVGPKIITRPQDDTNPHQHWEIWVDQVKGGVPAAPVSAAPATAAPETAAPAAPATAAPVAPATAAPAPVAEAGKYEVEWLGKRGILTFPSAFSDQPTTAQVKLYGPARALVQLELALTDGKWREGKLEFRPSFDL